MTQAMRGDEFYLYRATDFGSPVWDECDQVQDVKWKRSKEKKETVRRSKKRKQYRQGVEDIECTVTMEYRDGDPDRLAFDDSYDNETILVLATMNGDMGVAGNEGIKDQFIVVDYEEDQSHGEVVVLQYTLVPADVEEDPETITTV